MSHKCKCGKEDRKERREHREHREHRERRESCGILDCLCGGGNGWLMFLIFVLLILGLSGGFGLI